MAHNNNRLPKTARFPGRKLLRRERALERARSTVEGAQTALNIARDKLKLPNAKSRQGVADAPTQKDRLAHELKAVERAELVVKRLVEAIARSQGRLAQMGLHDRLAKVNQSTNV